ncbi:class II aldolase/adducin family protein [bacterium]|nr:class II aldolase/adducin family protein [candidate division CSSED10-310 bacterium]
MNEPEQKSLLIEIGKRLWTRGFVAANDGNLSVRINDKEILVTASGLSKGFLTKEMILKVDLDGNPISQNPDYHPSSEVKMHLEIYRHRKDIQAVVHAHPPYATSFAVAGCTPNPCVLPEAVLTLGAVPVAPYGTPSTEKVPQSIRSYIDQTDVILLANHGALTMGEDLLTAYHRMETLEHTAQITFLAMQMGKVHVIPQNEIEKLMEVRKQMKIPGRIIIPQSEPVDMNEAIIDAITKRVVERLKK